MNARIESLLTAILTLRRGGHSEGVGYDGYIADFAVPWLSSVDETRRTRILVHPRFDDLLDESIALAAPGNVAHVAEIGDVEPKGMPFHLSAHARLMELREDPRRLWLLRRCRIDWLRSEALAALRDRVDGGTQQAPEVHLRDAHYAVCLRSGWEASDLAVAASCSNSPMSHLQCDAGHVVIGTRGKWLIGDPGYQQYMKKQERVFTLGETAHNAPMIDGCPQTRKLVERRYRVSEESGFVRAEIDLTDAYEVEGLSSVARTVWLSGRDCVVVADRVGGAVEELAYSWHGDPDAAWWVADGVARVYLPEATLWISCPGTDLREADVDRLPGSRGHLTLRATVLAGDGKVFWCFTTGDERPDVEREDGAVTVKGLRFEAQ